MNAQLYTSHGRPVPASARNQEPPAGCAAIHLRHIRKTGGGSLRHLLFRLHYQKQPTFGSPVERDAYKIDLDQLASNRTYFGMRQAGRRLYWEYHSPWDLNGPWFLQQLAPRLPALRRAYAASNCTLLLVLLLREPVAHYVSDK